MERALDSVRSQIFTDFEVVVVDDGSTDNSLEIVEEYGRRHSMNNLRVIPQANAGVGAARNRGIRAAAGELVAFLDADDEWEPGHLDDLMSLRRDFPDCRLLATNYGYCSPQGKRTSNRLANMPFIGDRGVITNYFEIAAASAPPLWTSAVMTERATLLAVGGFPENIRSGEDLLTWARLALTTPIAYSLRPSAVYHQGNSNPRPPEKSDEVGLQLEALYRENRNAAGLGRYLALWFNMRMSRCLAYRRYSGAVAALIKSVRYRPTLRIAKPLVRYTLLGLRTRN